MSLTHFQLNHSGCLSHGSTRVPTVYMVIEIGYYMYLSCQWPLSVIVPTAKRVCLKIYHTLSMSMNDLAHGQENGLVNRVAERLQSTESSTAEGILWKCGTYTLFYTMVLNYQAFMFSSTKICCMPYHGVSKRVIMKNSRVASFYTSLYVCCLGICKKMCWIVVPDVTCWSVLCKACLTGVCVCVCISI